ncbi:MAG: hypothetical protein ONB11_04325 [candidate division KSB1 bacterium]|nr:hypothetical protein [candidate division KSB1 bacterium]MDZ7342440.1 hypothetical protein [candidate division KSB1 bacterium]
MYQAIITHNDFDGIVSATLCSYVYKIDHIVFAGPNTIARAELPITRRDIVCDLPYPLECGLWFDHHEGNLQELKYRHIDPASIPGKFDLQPSCARVIFQYFHEQQPFPDYLIALVADTDQIDSFNYQSIAEWRTETPAKIIDATIRSRHDELQEKRRYLKRLVLWLRKTSAAEVAQNAEIVERYQHYLREEEEMLSLIRQNSYFLPQDKAQEIIILDLTNFNRQPSLAKSLAYLIYPQALAVLEVKNLFYRGTKSNDLSFSLSLSINLNHGQHAKDVGEIMRLLNVGDGHKGAAAGKLSCASKHDMLKQKQHCLDRILAIWQEQQ